MTLVGTSQFKYHTDSEYSSTNVTAFRREYSKPAGARFAVVGIYGTASTVFTEMTIGGVTLTRVAVRTTTANTCLSVFAGWVEDAPSDGTLLITRTYTGTCRFAGVIGWTDDMADLDVDALTVSQITSSSPLTVSQTGENLLMFISITTQVTALLGTAGFTLEETLLSMSTRTEWAYIGYGDTTSSGLTVYADSDTEVYGVIVPVHAETYDTTRQAYPRNVA